MTKCSICKKKLEENFLAKPLGCAFKDAKGKLHWACSSCQKNKSKDELLKQI